MWLKIMSLVILLLCGLWLGTAWAATTPQATYKRYIHSIINKDIQGFARTLTSAEVFHYIDSHGKRTDSRRTYVDGHRRWFKETNWEIDYEPPLIVERGHVAYAMAVFHYRETQKDRTIHRLDAYFTLIMFKENGEWTAIADIVTPIASR
jgi:ketosteroid isomerase-like protein